MRVPRKPVARRDVRYVRGEHSAQALQRAWTADGEVPMHPMRGMDDGERVCVEMLEGRRLDKARRNHGIRIHGSATHFRVEGVSFVLYGDYTVMRQIRRGGTPVFRRDRSSISSHFGSD
jgi:hypothetical protein